MLELTFKETAYVFGGIMGYRLNRLIFTASLASFLATIAMAIDASLNIENDTSAKIDGTKNSDGAKSLRFAMEVMSTGFILISGTLVAIDGLNNREQL